MRPWRGRENRTPNARPAGLGLHCDRGVRFERRLGRSHPRGEPKVGGQALHPRADGGCRQEDLPGAVQGPRAREPPRGLHDHPLPRASEGRQPGVRVGPADHMEGRPESKREPRTGPPVPRDDARPRHGLRQRVHRGDGRLDAQLQGELPRLLQSPVRPRPALQGTARRAPLRKVRRRRTLHRLHDAELR